MLKRLARIFQKPKRPMVMQSQRDAIRALAMYGPDEIFHEDHQALIPPLRRAGLLTTHGCSDGDYIHITEKGRALLANT